MHGLLEPAGIALPGLLLRKERTAVAGGTARRGHVLVGDGITAVRVEHGHPHGIVERLVGVPEPGLRASDALVFDLHAEGLLVVKLPMAVVVCPGSLSFVPFHAPVGQGAAGMDGLAMAERGPAVAAKGGHLAVQQVGRDRGHQILGMRRTSRYVDGADAECIAYPFRPGRIRCRGGQTSESGTGAETDRMLGPGDYGLGDLQHGSATHHPINAVVGRGNGAFYDADELAVEF